MKIAYLTDSSISISKKDDFFNNEDVFFIPLHINIDSDDILDDGKYDRQALIKRIYKAKKVITSQPSPGEIEVLLDEIIAKGYDVLVCACIGSGLSGTQNVIYSVAIEKNITIVNLDSKGAGAMQIKALKLFKEEVQKGLSLVDIQNKVQHMLDVSNCYAVVDDLTYLQKGGRISLVSAKFGTLLKIKPLVMTAKEMGGRVVPYDKVRTRKKALQRVVETAFENIVASEYEVVIGNFDADDDAPILKAMIEKMHPQTKVEIMDLCFAVGVHTGPNTLVLFTIRDH
ncbi:MAG: DegV family protein [Bacilli bacterium]|jgi:DegV family protein with EDD domain|nr:DegV family protein [Bacilli bacterium]